MTVRELLARIDSRELSEWGAYYRLEPWGTEVDDYRSGVVASTIANVNRDPKQRRQPFVPEDFVPKREQPKKEEQSPDDIRRIVEMWHVALGGR